LQEKILKGTEEDQFERNVFGILVVATSGCVGGAHSTCEEELWAHNPHAVWVRNGSSSVVISTTFANVVRIGRDSGQTVLSTIYTIHISVIYISYPKYIQ
jgi:hypothetical protein